MQNFKIGAECGSARAGTLKTAHGTIQTPFFMPVATKGSVKHLSVEEVKSTGTECMISNAFVLSLKPGVETIERHGGLHKFIGWEGAMFTDSGGFQVLSDEFRLKLSGEGVTFRNPYTGKASIFSPENAIETENKIGADVVMCLDDVPKAGSTLERVKEAVEHTTDWARRCLEAHSNKKQMLFGICQGGTHEKLRQQSVQEISALGFDGIAIGGLAIGETKENMYRAVNFALPHIPKEKPRYLMGVGSVQELVESIALGVDCFDSNFATRTGRHGRAFSSEGNLNIDAAIFRNDLKPLDWNCTCYVCKNHTRSYIHHLFRTKEENAGKYLSYHNIYFIQKTFDKIRRQIKENEFSPKKFEFMLE